MYVVDDAALHVQCASIVVDWVKDVLF